MVTISLNGVSITVTGLALNLQTRKRNLVDNIHQSTSFVKGYLHYKFVLELLPYQEVEQMESINFFLVKLINSLRLSLKNSNLHMRRNIRFQIWATQECL